MATIKVKIKIQPTIFVHFSAAQPHQTICVCTKPKRNEMQYVCYLLEIAHSLIANPYLIWKYSLLAFDCKMKSLLSKLNGTFSRLENTNIVISFTTFFSLSCVIDNKLLSLYLLCGSPTRSQHSDTIESTIALAHIVACVCFLRGANNVENVHIKNVDTKSITHLN